MTLRSHLLVPVVLGSALLAVAGCDLTDLAADTPLGATAQQRGTVIGEAVRGTVQYPDGTITVTLAPADLPEPTSGSNSEGPGVTGCDYDSESHAFACPTGGRQAGLYRVEVTDATFASEGTTLVSVALTDDPGYQPQVLPPTDDAVRLVGWAPGSQVRVWVRDLDSGTTSRLGDVTVGADGAATVTLERPLGASSRVLASDGLWDDRGVQGWDFRA